MDLLLPDVCEKENVQHTDTVKVDPGRPPSTPLRTPLQDVVHNSRSSRLKTSYVPITPVSAKTLRRKSRTEPVQTVFQDELDLSQQEFPINSLVYKKVMELVSKASQEYEEKLSVKDQIINDLREQLTGMDTQGDAGTKVRIIPPTPITDVEDSSPESVVFEISQNSPYPAAPKMDLSLIYRDTGSLPVYLSPNYKSSHANTDKKSLIIKEKNDTKVPEGVTDNIYHDEEISDDVFCPEQLPRDLNNIYDQNIDSDSCKLSDLKETDCNDCKDNGLEIIKQGLPSDLLNCVVPEPTLEHDYSVKHTCTSNVMITENIIEEECTTIKSSSDVINEDSSDSCNLKCNIENEILRDACSSPISSVDVVHKACSPVHSVDIVHTACSPMQLTDGDHDTKNSSATKDVATLTDPQIAHVDREICKVTPTKSKLSVRHHSATTSVQCSPFLTDTRELGVTANIPVLATDVTTETEKYSLVNKEVDVRPLLNSAHTMTETTMFKSCETSMTPVKIHNKFGKRLTAEEVRKQHPRALANELDTMSVCASRLQGEVGHLEKERNHLRSQVRDLKKNVHKKEESLSHLEEQKEEEKIDFLAKCSKLEAELVEKEELRKAGDMTCEQWRQHCADLEKEMDRLLEAHQKEIKSIREELEREDYRPHFEHSQRLVQELQAEIAEFADIGDNLEAAEKLQEEIKDVISVFFVKMTDTQEHIQAVSKELQVQQADVNKQKKENEALAEKLRLEREELLEENADTKRTMELCRQNIVQLEGLYNSTSADLLSATTQVCLLNKELVSCKKICTEAQLSKQAITSQVADLEENEKMAFLEIQALQAAMALQEREMEKATKRYVEVQTEYLQQQKELRKNKEEYELVTNNLQRTLESREQDIEIQEKDLYECRELIIEQRDKLDILEPVEEENSKLRTQCTDLQKTVDELRESLRVTEEELVVTKDHASRLILQQGAELRDCSMAVQDLSSRMNYVLTTLRTKVGLQAEKEDNLHKHTTKKEEKCSRTVKEINSRQSLVSLVLAAADGDAEAWKPSSVDEPEVSSGSNPSDSPATASRKQLGSSSASAFQPVKSSSVTEPADVSADVSEKSNESCEQNSSVTDQICLLCTTLKEIIRMANILEEASKLSIQDLKTDSLDAATKLDHYKQTQRQTEAELQIKKDQLIQTEQTITEMRCKMEAMSENLSRFSDQEYKIRALEDEVSSLKHQVTKLESEKELLAGHLEEIIQRHDEQQNDDVRVLKAKYDRDILAFKKKIQKLRDHLWEKEEHYDTVGNKASKRMEILKENWQKAEAEVHRLDSLIESIRETLVNDQKDGKKMGTFQSLLKIIDGVDSQDTKPKGKENQPLQVIQTEQRGK